MSETITVEQWKALNPSQRSQYRAIGCGMVIDHTSTFELDDVLCVDHGLITPAGEATGFRYERQHR